jgi:hypothetical protein
MLEAREVAGLLLGLSSLGSGLLFRFFSLWDIFFGTLDVYLVSVMIWMLGGVYKKFGDFILMPAEWRLGVAEDKHKLQHYHIDSPCRTTPTRAIDR